MLEARGLVVAVDGPGAQQRRDTASALEAPALQAAACECACTNHGAAKRTSSSDRKAQHEGKGLGERKVRAREGGRERTGSRGGEREGGEREEWECVKW